MGFELKSFSATHLETLVRLVMFWAETTAAEDARSTRRNRTASQKPCGDGAPR